MKVICLSGKARAGKDTSAEIIKKLLVGYGASVLVIHYADLLKYMCKQLFHWNGEKDERGRHLLQYVGTDVIRSQEPNFWVNFVVSVLNLFPDEWDYVLIPDTRFPNEIERMREAGFKVLHVRIERPCVEDGLTDEQRNHPSETALDETRADIIISNDGTIVDLTKKLVDFVCGTRWPPDKPNF